MQKRNLDNKTLDALGRKLFEVESMPPSEIEKIISNSRMFSLVIDKIAENNDRAKVGSSQRWFVSSKSFALSGLVAVLLLTLAAFNILRSEKIPVVADVLQTPDAIPETARPVFPPQGTIEGKLSAGRTLKAEYRAEKIRPARRAKSARIPVVSIEADGEFYPIAYTGDLSETAGGGRIIRVDLKRSSLFALGVNLPLENYDETIKTDLLVGADGVARGVRVVN